MLCGEAGDFVLRVREGVRDVKGSILKELNERDSECLMRQLGRLPQGVVRVAVRSMEGEPVVIENYPVHHCKGCEERLVPFPTLYWLTSPRLHHMLAEHERTGLIDRLQKKIEGNGDLEHAVAGDHKRYIEERWELLTRDDREIVGASPYLLETLRVRGIGGISNFMMVKCLHLHYAHHLAKLSKEGEGGTTVGRLIEGADEDLLRVRKDFEFECV